MIIPFFQVLFERIPETNQMADSIPIVHWFESKFLGLIKSNGKQYALLFVCGSLVVVFFLKNLFFDKLAGADQLRLQIIADKTEGEIRDSWEEGLKAFKATRTKYLIYE